VGGTKVKQVMVPKIKRNLENSYKTFPNIKEIRKAGKVIDQIAGIFAECGKIAKSLNRNSKHIFELLLLRKI